MALRLETATWTDVRDAETSLAVLPVGSTEQHGPHAALGTDAATAEVVAEAGVEAHDGTAVIAPTVPVGVSEEHRAFPGTLWVSPDTFRAYVRETVESLASHGFDRVVVVNGHGGNVGPLRETCARVSRAGAAYAAPFTWFEAVESGPGMGHAGPLETALLCHARPDLVEESRIETAAEGGSDRWGEWVAGVNLAYDTDEFSQNGVVGDPRAGGAALGADLLAEAAAALSELLEAVATR
jgi:creatinine amidohydrolase